MATDTDVLIVGYGPVGQVLASLLGSRGHRVIVCERNLGPYPLPRAGHFDHEIMRIFQSIGISDEVELVSEPARSYQFLDGSGRVISSLPREWVPQSGWDASYHFYQPELERVLDERARSFENVSVRRGATVTGVRQSANVVITTISDVTGSTEEIRSRFVVGADGANSVIRQSLGIEVDDLGFVANWLVVDLRVFDGVAIPDIPDTAQILDPSRPSFMARLFGPYLRWEFMLLDGDDPEQMATDENVWEFLKRWITPDQGALIRKAIYQFRAALASEYRSGSALLVGDAAHLMPPTLGQGMCSGIRDAATLSWMLDLALRGISDEKLLDAYVHSRKAHVEAYIRESVRIGSIVCETDPELAEKNIQDLESLSSAPPPFQPLVSVGSRSSDQLAGSLGVQPTVLSRKVGSSRLDDVLGQGFQLLTTGEALRTIDSETQSRLDRMGVVHAHIEDADSSAHSELNFVEVGSRFADWLANAGVVAVLVRPDFYVYGSIRSAGDLGELLTALESDLHLK